ncbi:MAG: DUF2058 family protein [Myxococcota bacterium]
MLDLKAKLLKAGLVTEEQVHRVEAEEQAVRDRRREKHAQGKTRAKNSAPPPSEAERWQRRVEGLKEAPKAEQYETIRGWVQRTRLDPVKGLPSDGADRFHFARHDGHISWLTLEPEVKAALAEGRAGIIAFMSHNGLAHCVVPRDVAQDVGTVRPEWVRHLDGFDVVTLAPKETGSAAAGEVGVETTEPATSAAEGRQTDLGIVDEGGGEGA